MALQVTFCLIFSRYANFGPYSEEDEQVKKTLCSFLDIWMNKNSEYFCEPSDLLTLKYLRSSYSGTLRSSYMAHSDLSVHVNRIQIMLQEKKAKDSQSKDEEDSDLGRHTSSDPEM